LSLTKLKVAKNLIFMRPKIWNAIVLFGAGLSLMQSCVDKTPQPIICGCEGTGAKSFEEVDAIVVSTTEGYFLLSPFTGYYSLCNDLAPDLQTDGLMVGVSGTTKSTCSKPDDVFMQQQTNYSNISTISVATDSIFSVPPFQIRIIKSEDYGYSPGFGYRISHSSGFKIIQQTIPAIGGNKPFKTSTDAFKTAVLVSYKLNLEVGLPSLTVQDLRFLQVLY